MTPTDTGGLDEFIAFLNGKDELVLGEAEKAAALSQSRDVTEASLALPAPAVAAEETVTERRYRVVGGTDYVPASTNPVPDVRPQEDAAPEAQAVASVTEPEDGSGDVQAGIMNKPYFALALRCDYLPEHLVPEAHDVVRHDTCPPISTEPDDFTFIRASGRGRHQLQLLDLHNEPPVNLCFLHALMDEPSILPLDILRRQGFDAGLEEFDLYFPGTRLVGPHLREVIPGARYDAATSSWRPIYREARERWKSDELIVVHYQMARSGGASETIDDHRIVHFGLACGIAAAFGLWHYNVLDVQTLASELFAHLTSGFAS